MNRFLVYPIFRTFLGDFSPQKLPSGRLQTLWEWKNRVPLEEYYIFNVAIPCRFHFKCCGHVLDCGSIVCHRAFGSHRVLSRRPLHARTLCLDRRHALFDQAQLFLRFTIVLNWFSIGFLTKFKCDVELDRRPENQQKQYKNHGTKSRT